MHVITLPLSATWPWLHSIAALLAGAAFGSIAALLLSIARRQRDSSTHRLLWLLGICLAACGAVQLVRLIDAWSPLSGPAGALMLLFAAGVWGLAWALPLELPKGDLELPKGSPERPKDEPPAVPVPAGDDVTARTRDLQELTGRLQAEVIARRRVEQSLRESEERLRLVVSAGRMGTWDWDLATGATRLDRQERQLFGLPETPGTVPVDEIFNHMHPDDRAGVRTACQKAIDTYTAYDHEFRVVLGDGSIRWLAGRGDVIRSADGAALRMVGVNFDVTERRIAEQHYRLIDRALHSATNGVLIADAEDEDFPIIYVNEGFETLTGYSSDEVLGRNCRFLQGPNSDTAVVAEIRESLAAGADCHVTILNYRKDGSHFWNELRITPVRNDAGRLTHFVGVQADVTERKSVEESLQRAEARAQAASQAKSEFLANMSHEIRTPLTAVLGCADTLYPRLSSQEHREMVQMIRNQGRLLLGILNDVLDLSKIEAGKLEIQHEVCSIVGVIEDVRSLLHPQALEKGLELRSEYASEMPVEIRTDPLRVRQVLVNLVSNAVKFTERGEVAIIAFCDIESDPPQLVVNVRDTGIGIAPHKLEAIFEAFSQENAERSRKVGGTGLGLTISQRLLVLLGGSIRVASQPQRGTTFTVSLPITVAEAAHLQSGSELTQASLDQQKSRDSLDIILPIRVLLAEDTRGLQFMIRRMLEDAGATVAVVDNGERAVAEVARSNRAGVPFNVILMDMQMPLVDGFEATRQLRSAGCRLPIIALTAAAMHGDRERCLSAGCDDYLSKPIDRHLLLDVVSRLYNRLPASR